MLSKSEIITQVTDLLKGEKFKEDAFFFCGSKTVTPDKDLMRACENYLSDPVQENAADLLHELKRIYSEKESLMGEFQVESSELSVIRSLLDSSELF